MIAVTLTPNSKPKTTSVRYALWKAVASQSGGAAEPSSPKKLNAVADHLGLCLSALGRQVQDLSVLCTVCYVGISDYG